MNNNERTNIGTFFYKMRVHWTMLKLGYIHEPTKHEMLIAMLKTMPREQQVEVLRAVQSDEALRTVLAERKRAEKETEKEVKP